MESIEITPLQNAPQIIKFSTYWRVSEFVKFLPKKYNYTPPLFIISENFSPFSQKLFDAYIELDFENFLEEQWKSISAYANFKSYFSEPIQVSFKICFWDTATNVAKGKKRKNVTLERCGRFGFRNLYNDVEDNENQQSQDPPLQRNTTDLKQNKQHGVVQRKNIKKNSCWWATASYVHSWMPNKIKSKFPCLTNILNLQNDLLIICKVKLKIDNPKNQKIFVKHETVPFENEFYLKNYLCPQINPPSFNAVTRLEPFVHFWKIENINKLLEMDQVPNPFIFSDIFSSEFQNKFSLTFWPNGYNKKNKESIICLFNNVHTDAKNVQWRIKILNEQGDQFKEHLIFAVNSIIESINFSSFVLKHDLFVNLPNDNLSIKIEGHAIVNENLFFQQNYICKKTESCFDMSSITTNKLTHVWSIEHFSQVCGVKKHGTPLLVSSVFVYKEIKFYLVLLPNKNKQNGFNDHMSLFLRCENLPQNETFIQAKIFLINSKGEKTNKKLIFGNLKSIVSNIDTLKFISFKDIKQSKENFLQNDKMTIYFEGEILKKENLSEIERINNLAIFSCKEHLPVENFLNTCETCKTKEQQNFQCSHVSSYFNVVPNVISFTHKWTIDNYHEVCQEKLSFLNTNQNNEVLKRIESVFLPEKGKHKNLELAVALYPFGFENEDNNSISILLNLKSFNEEKAYIQYRFSIINQNNKKILSKEKINFFNKSDNVNNKSTFGFKEFISVSKLLKQKNKFLPDDKLTIYLEGEVIMEENISDANLYNYNQLFIAAKSPVIDCIVTDKNTQIFNITKQIIHEKSNLELGTPNFEQDLLKNLTFRDLKIFFTTNNVNNSQLNNSVLNVDSEVSSKEIKCVSEVKKTLSSGETKNEANLEN